MLLPFSCRVWGRFQFTASVSSIDWRAVDDHARHVRDERAAARAGFMRPQRPEASSADDEDAEMFDDIWSRVGFTAVSLPELTARLPEETLAQVERRHGLLRVLRSRPDRFRVESDVSGLVHVAAVSSDIADARLPDAPSLDAAVAHLGPISSADGHSPAAEGTTHQPNAELLSRCPVALAGDASRLFKMLQPLMPSAFFVPLPVMYEQLPPHIKRAVEEEFGQGVECFFKALEALSAREVDVRVLGDSAKDVFVRAIAENLPCFLESEEGDEYFAQYDVAGLATPLYEALIGQGPVPIDQLVNVLSPALFAALPLHGAAAILVFDRLQYAFEVAADTYTIVARPTVEPGMTGLTMRSTPSPRALRFILTNLIHPTTLATVEKELPEEIAALVATHFGDLEQFVAMHPLYLFVKDGDILWSTELHQRYDQRAAASRAGGTANSVWRREIAEFVAKCLPADRAVTWRNIRFQLPPEYAKEVGNKPRTFLDHYRDLFSCYNLLEHQSFVVQRAALPAPRNAIPPINSEHDLLRVVAMHLVDPKSLEQLSHVLPADAKQAAQDTAACDGG
jgi:hypothetical protein